ncbi:MAG: DUF4390 domain-containing protein [Proteobacteria bacterium]|nr:DUF4390 domain-containing protein [Pseudomonadota bacterium]
MKKIPFFSLTGFALLFLCLLMAGNGRLFAQEAQLENIIVTNTRDDLLVFLNVDGAFTASMKEAVTSGVPITFSFYINLYNTRNFWLDKKIASVKITHKLKYDTLKKEFILKRSWGKNEPVVVESFEEAEKLMCKIDSILLTKLDRLKKGEQYQIRTKAELAQKTLPLNLHHVLFFVSLWDFETDWYTIDFIY